MAGLPLLSDPALEAFLADIGFGSSGPAAATHLDELRGKAAALRASNRDLAARLRGARARAALVSLTNARLRAEAGALARRLAAARRAIALRQLYAAAAAATGGFEMQALASLIA
ncbi:hypothetical protein E2562_028989 [Oryza meyeriana var. granulata]|uniref:HAUS augmin-like complex subunit 3 N-terminal domain-containing protein n=1 Tax=Oryza meyeriana var. granulata TaxID=110450 RepID=A0A6G1DS70_9ORYZ|nr:hypothetical protein E2562_028989 [Oryza meyeriana var. granulata]